MNILATLVYLQKNGKTLMIRHAEHKHELYKGKWNGLGGKILEEETPEECAKREVFEESGYKPKELKLVGILTFPKVDGKNDWYVFAYTCSKFTERLRESKEGLLQWHNSSELLKLKLWEGDHVFLPWILEKKFFSAKFIYNKGKLIEHEEIFYN